MTETDYGTYLEDFVHSIENLPGEIHHLFSEIRERGQDLQEIKETMKEQDITLRRLIKSGSSHPDPVSESENIRDLLPQDQKHVFDMIKQGFSEAIALSEEQEKVAERALSMLDRHIKRLTSDLDKMNETEGLPPVSSIPIANYVYQAPEYSDSPALGLSFLSNNGVRARPNMTRKGIKRRVFGDLSDGPEEGGDIDETLYCFCQQISYGEMIGCENGEDCPYEWFHLDCVGLTEPPTGIWFCPECSRKRKRMRMNSS